MSSQQRYQIHKKGTQQGLTRTYKRDRPDKTLIKGAPHNLDVCPKTLRYENHEIKRQTYEMMWRLEINQLHMGHSSTSVLKYQRKVTTKSLCKKITRNKKSNMQTKVQEQN